MSTLAVRSRTSEDGFVERLMTVRDCRSLVNSDLLEPGKFELIEGRIVFKTSQGRLHIGIITRVVAALSAIFGIESIQNQAQIGIGELDEFNDPEPDAAVLRGKVMDYAQREPYPSTEILLAVEVANTSLIGDTTTKARIYA